MDHWQSDFRERMARFGIGAPSGSIPVSIKVRITSGCFHREHSPEAYKTIDASFALAREANPDYRLEDHETGPEILAILAVTAAGLTFTASVIDLITAIINARSDGIKNGDRPSDPVEIVVRGHWKSGEYFEEKILRIPHDQIVTEKLVKDALDQSFNANRKGAKKRATKKKKK